MTRNERNKEFNKGRKAFDRVLPLLEQHFPLAFPRDPRQTWPLSGGLVVNGLALHFGWPVPFARGVVHRWILRRSYCNAILLRKWRIGLDGVRTGERVDKQARKRAALRLEEMKRRHLQPLLNAAAREHRRVIARLLRDHFAQQRQASSVD